MAKWASDKILGSSFITHSTSNGYEIHFATPDREKYLAVQEECRRQIDHAKPLTNADRIRQMTDEEMSYFIARQRFYAVNKIADKLGIDVTPSFLNERKKAFCWLTQEVESDA